MAKALLHHRCDIQRATVNNDRGYESKSWSLHKADVRCLFQEKKGQLGKDEHAGEGGEYDGVVYFARGTDVRPRTADDVQDRLIMKTPRTDGATLLVLFVGDQSGRAWKRGNLKVFVKRVPPDAPPS